MEPREFYQQWIIAYLVAAGGTASLDALSKDYPASLDDPTKKLPLSDRMRLAIRRVLSSPHGIADIDAAGVVTLNCEPLEVAEQIRIMYVCLTREFKGKTLGDAISN